MNGIEYNILMNTIYLISLIAISSIWLGYTGYFSRKKQTIINTIKPIGQFLVFLVITAFITSIIYKATGYIPSRSLIVGLAVISTLTKNLQKLRTIKIEIKKGKENE